MFSLLYACLNYQDVLGDIVVRRGGAFTLKLQRIRAAAEIVCGESLDARRPGIGPV